MSGAGRQKRSVYKTNVQRKRTWDIAYLVSLPPHSRGGNIGQAQGAFLLRVVDVVQDDCISGEDALDLRLEKRHGGWRGRRDELCYG